MEKTMVFAKEAPWGEFALEEFRALNEEILERIRRQNTFVGFSLILASALIPTINLWINVTQASFVILAVSFILWIILLVYIEQDYQVAVIGNYIFERIYPLFDIHELGNNPCWEIYRSNNMRTQGIGIRLSMAAKYAFLIIPMLIVDIVIIPLVTIQLGLTRNLFIWIIIGYCLVIITKYFFSFLSFRETIMEYYKRNSL